jgi:hypothetical protein
LISKNKHSPERKNANHFLSGHPATSEDVHGGREFSAHLMMMGIPQWIDGHYNRGVKSLVHTHTPVEEEETDIVFNFKL